MKEVEKISEKCKKDQGKLGTIKETKENSEKFEKNQKHSGKFRKISET